MINPFVWRDDVYSVEVKLIDDQHKRLFEIGSEIFELTDNDLKVDTYDSIVKLVDELVDYTKYHFKTEEDLFEKYNYTDLASHKQEHKKFLEKLSQIDLGQINSDQKKVLKDILMFVFQWIMDHIRVTDSKYVDFMKENVTDSDIL